MTSGGSDAITAACLSFDRNGNLYVGGRFDSAGHVAAKNIARWNGKQWQPLGSGVSDYMISLTVSDSTLFVGGQFQKAGGKQSPFIARCNIHNEKNSVLPRAQGSIESCPSFHSIASKIVFFGLAPDDRVLLYSLAGRRIGETQGASHMDLSGLSSQTIVVRIHRRERFIATGKVVVQ
jgi:hypothetical protein